MPRARSTTTILAGAAVPLAALALAACGGGGRAATAARPPTSPTHAAISVAHTGLGNILVDSQDRTLYLFKADSGAKSTCFGACAAVWPPLLAGGTLTAGPGVKVSLIGTIARSDGKPQLTYNDHPLYLYAGDQKPGETNGEGSSGFGAPWFALSVQGDQVSGGASAFTGAPAYR
jgi:predicted lipoprotein with Yx(FWY)xxD motif